MVGTSIGTAYNWYIIASGQLLRLPVGCDVVHCTGAECLSAQLYSHSSKFRINANHPGQPI